MRLSVFILGNARVEQWAGGPSVSNSWFSPERSGGGNDGASAVGPQRQTEKEKLLFPVGLDAFVKRL